MLICSYLGESGDILVPFWLAVLLKTRSDEFELYADELRTGVIWRVRRTHNQYMAQNLKHFYLKPKQYWILIVSSLRRLEFN